MSTSYSRWTRQKQREDRACNFTKSWRVIVDDKVISQTPARLGDEFARRMCEHFRDNILSAFAALKKGERWTWDDKPDGMQAQEWVEFHEDRLGMKLSENVEIVGPGESYRLAPNIEAII